MRIKLKFSGTKEQVPFETQKNVNGYIHKCLGFGNKYHDAKNDYCVSSLLGGKVENGVLTYPDGAYILVTSENMDFINSLVGGVIQNTDLAFGMKFIGIDYISEKFYDGWNYFRTLTPFLIKEYKDKKTYSYLKLGDKDFNNKVENYLKTKIAKIDPTLDLSDFKVEIPNMPFNKVKKIMVKNVSNYANNCQLAIHTNKKVAKLLYNIGIGQSTGSGFGTIAYTSSYKLNTGK